MTAYSWLILGLWLVFIAVWAIFGRRAKRNIKSGFVWSREIGLRLAIVVLILIAWRVVDLGHTLPVQVVNKSPVPGTIGVALCTAGVGLAIWARLHLGSNWGMPMSRKENAELVVSGPYATIRHPIYTGILLAVLGSAIGISIHWALVLVLFAPYFIYSARREEAIMIEEFPDQYPAYMRRTNMLVPYIL